MPPSRIADISAIVGLGNKSDIDEDDLLLFFEQDDNTKVIAQHCEDLKDGRAFAEVAKRVSKKKPVIMLKAGRTSAGAAAASSHTGALAGNDKIYDDVLRQSGVVRAGSLRQMLDFARGVPILPTPKGENVVIITGAGERVAESFNGDQLGAPLLHLEWRPLTDERQHVQGQIMEPDLDRLPGRNPLGPLVQHDIAACLAEPLQTSGLATRRRVENDLRAILPEAARNGLAQTARLIQRPPEDGSHGRRRHRGKSLQEE